MGALALAGLYVIGQRPASTQSAPAPTPEPAGDKPGYKDPVKDPKQVAADELNRLATEGWKWTGYAVVAVVFLMGIAASWQTAKGAARGVSRSWKRFGGDDASSIIVPPKGRQSGGKKGKNRGGGSNVAPVSDMLFTNSRA